MNTFGKRERTSYSAAHTRYDSNAMNSSERAHRRNMFKAISEDSDSNSEDSHSEKNTYHKTGVFSRISYSWISSLIEKANKGKLFLKNITKVDTPEQLIKVS